MTHRKNKSLIKGVYEHYQLSGYFTVKQYIVVTEKGKRCLLLRFENELKTVVNAVEFLVKQLDDNGNTVGNTRITYKDLFVAPGQLYCSQKGIIIDKNCVDFVIQMTYVISDKTKYMYKKGLVTAHYDSRGYVEKQTSLEEDEEKEENKVILKRKKVGVGFYRLLALISFLIAAATVYTTLFAGL